MSDFSSFAKTANASNPSQASGDRTGQEPSESQRLESQYIEEVDPGAQGQNAFNSERPLDVQPTQSGGVARDGKEGLPKGKAGLVDKAFGKVEKVIGKATRNDDKHEAGELRESGGKGAVAGQARAPHD
ncbi:hypothetical protein EDB84DRAFT_803146 [Lactarius hengduanensis]|nr:hypothetical protein EDB84DRAFT_803146 [Lactarius hengduanensis]